VSAKAIAARRRAEHEVALPIGIVVRTLENEWADSRIGVGDAHAATCEAFASAIAVVPYIDDPPRGAGLH
jgi:hypothetical protein